MQNAHLSSCLRAGSETGPRSDGEVLRSRFLGIRWPLLLQAPERPRVAAPIDSDDETSPARFTGRVIFGAKKFTIPGGLVLTGVTQLSLPKDIRSGWSIAVGIINVLFGVLLGFLAIFNPVQNVWTLAWVAGIYMIILGIYALVLAFQVRKSTRD